VLFIAYYYDDQIKETLMDGLTELIGDMRNAYTNLVEKPESKIRLGGQRRRS
jgi:hypothetical protein